MTARTIGDIDRLLSRVVELRRRAPDQRFHQILSRRIDSLLADRTHAKAQTWPAAEPLDFEDLLVNVTRPWHESARAGSEAHPRHTHRSMGEVLLPGQPTEEGNGGDDAITTS